jgi:hypothetical protein
MVFKILSDSLELFRSRWFKKYRQRHSESLEQDLTQKTKNIFLLHEKHDNTDVQHFQNNKSQLLEGETCRNEV